MRKFVSASLFVMGMACDLSAQPPDPNGGGKPGTVPISGIEWLLLGGGILGLRKTYLAFKSRKN